MTYFVNKRDISKRSSIGNVAFFENQKVWKDGYYKTDYLDYFEQMLSVSRAQPDLVETHCRTIKPDQADPEAADTNFERKYLLLGRPIYIANYQKPPA